MFLMTLTKLIKPLFLKKIPLKHTKTCHSVFDIKDFIQEEKLDNFTLCPVTVRHQEMAIDIIKRHYLSEHVLVRARNMDLINDRALDEYLVTLIKQGNSVYAKTEDGSIAGVCVSFASSPIDPRNLRNFAFYRQDPNTKDFLYFTAKLQETPNLWEAFNQQKVFEIKMLTVVPEYRRQGLAVMLADKCKEQGYDQGYNIIRMDCINPYDYKIAERSMLQCIVKFPLHKLRGVNAPYIKRNSDYNRYVRVYVAARTHSDIDRAAIKRKQSDLESLIE